MQQFVSMKPKRNNTQKFQNKNPKIRSNSQIYPFRQRFANPSQNNKRLCIKRTPSTQVHNTTSRIHPRYGIVFFSPLFFSLLSTPPAPPPLPLGVSDVTARLGQAWVSFQGARRRGGAWCHDAARARGGLGSLAPLTDGLQRLPCGHGRRCGAQWLVIHYTYV